MNPLKRWFGKFSNRGQAVALYKRGMEKAKDRDHQTAVDLYSDAIVRTKAPPDVKAMVLYNRALSWDALGENRKAADDLKAVMDMDGAPASVVTMAKHKIANMKSNARRSARPQPPS